MKPMNLNQITVTDHICDLLKAVIVGLLAETDEDKERIKFPSRDDVIINLQNREDWLNYLRGIISTRMPIHENANGQMDSECKN